MPGATELILDLDLTGLHLTTDCLLLSAVLLTECGLRKCAEAAAATADAWRDRADQEHELTGGWCAVVRDFAVSCYMTHVAVSNRVVPRCVYHCACLAQQS